MIKIWHGEGNMGLNNALCTGWQEQQEVGKSGQSKSGWEKDQDVAARSGW